MTGGVDLGSLRSEIEQVLSEGFACLDHDDLDGLVALLSEDVQFDAAGRTFTGRDQVRAVLAGRGEVRAAARHVLTNLRVEPLDDTTVRARYIAIVYHASHDDPTRGEPHVFTEWDDELVRDPGTGRWAARRRRLTPVFALGDAGARDVAAGAE